MNKPTPGPWIADLRTGCCAIYPASRVDDTPGCLPNDDRNIHFSRKGSEYKENEGWTMDAEAQANAALIVAAVNACFKVNPDNPLAVAEVLPELIEAAQKFIVKAKIEAKP